MNIRHLSESLHVTFPIHTDILFLCVHSHLCVVTGFAFILAHPCQVSLGKLSSYRSALTNAIKT